MANQVLKGLIDLLYGTKQKRLKYQKENPNETVLAIDGSKSILTKDNKEVQLGLDWLISQRAVVILTDKKIICGKWIIPLEQIKEAHLLHMNSLLGGGQILKIQTNDNKHYQFGMQLNPEWTNQQAIPLTLEKGQIKYSPFSIVLRIIAIAYLIYWFTH